MTAAAKRRIDLRKYGRLLARATPLVMETEAEYNRADAEVGRLLRKGHDNLSVEERRLLDLLSRLMEDYESRTFSVPEGRPYETLRFLMEQNELRQADLMQIFGSRGRVSEAVAGKRAISKAQAKGLAEFFRVSPDLFL